MMTGTQWRKESHRVKNATMGDENINDGIFDGIF
jgi:hypothetical protein